MGFITAGYDGTVDEVQLAKLLHRYSVVGAEDFKATTQAGDRIVAIADGTALGPGTVDVATAIPNIQFAAAAANTTRWDLVALRRDWQPPGGTSGIVIIQGGAVKGYPDEGTATTAWNRRPGIVDDQPLYLQEVNGTLLGERIDLRVWGNNSSGFFAKDLLVRTYMDAVGTVLNINGVRMERRLIENDAAGWREVTDRETTITKPTNLPWREFQGLISAPGGTDVNGYGELRFGQAGLPSFAGVANVQLTAFHPTEAFMFVPVVQDINNTRVRFRARRLDGSGWANGYGSISMFVTVLGW